MKLTHIIYQIGIWSLGIIGGTIHTLSELFFPKDQTIINSLENLTIVLPGKETNILALQIGVSLMMGTLLIALGIMNLLVNHNSKSDLPKKNIFILNWILSFLLLIISIKYLFIVPIFLIALSALCFTWAARSVLTQKIHL